MIARYSLSPMRELWTEEAQYKRWLEVELAAVEAQAELGEIPQDAAATIRAQAQVTAEAIERAKEIETELGHDILAFIQLLEEQVGPAGRFLHKGLTASDIKDTAQASAMRQGLAILIDELGNLLSAVERKALEHKHSLMAGRTHGLHAEPVTFGLKLLNWHYQMERDRQRLEQAREVISWGKLSGSVGTYAHLDPRVEAQVCAKLDLKPARITNQVIQRDRHAQVLAALAIVGASLERLAIEIRNLSRTEIAEVREGDPHGSSSMPHKHNPISSETISGLARVLRGNLQAQLESIALWHERDISHSSVERIIIPDSFTALHWMIRKTAQVLENLIVDKERMMKNLELSRGLIFSQAVLLKLVEKGMSRSTAHRLLQQLSLEVERQGRNLQKLLLEDAQVGEHLSPEEIERIFDYRCYLERADQIFSRFSR